LVQTNDTFEGLPAITGTSNGTNGAVAVNDNGTPGITDDDFIVYTPNADFNGTDSFTYTVTSGGISETATVNVTVNAVVDIANDTATTNEDTPANILVLANDTFEGTPAITGTGAATNGTVVVNNNGTPGSTADDFLVYTPNADFNGADSFTYTVTSGGVTETATVNVTVNPINDAPVLDLDTDNSAAIGNDYAVLYILHGTPVAITDTDDSIIDPDNATLLSATITLTNHQANDLLSVNGALPGNISASVYNPATGVLTLTSAGATATLAQWQTALHQIEFSNTGAANTTARDITIVVNDGADNSNTAHATISLEIPPTQFEDAALNSPHSRQAPTVGSATTSTSASWRM
jgi:hypothetical protein